MLADSFTLLRPQALWLLLLIPPAALLLWRAVQAAGSWTKAIDPILLPHLIEGETSAAHRRGPLFVALAMLLAVLAIAGPSFEKIEVPVFQRADALVLVLDLSASMSATDIQPSRVRRARQKILDLLAERTEGVTGLVVYAGDAHVVAPLTDDRRTIENLLPALDPSIMPVPGSNAESALAIAASLLGAAGVANGQILLLTDDMPKFDPDNVRSALADANADLSILGIGTAAGAPIPRADGGFIRSSNGEIVVPTLAAGELQNIANALGGRYATVSVDNSDINQLSQFRVLNEDGEVQLDRKTDTWLDQGNWLALALALALLPLFRRGALALLLILPLLQADPVSAQALKPTEKDLQPPANGLSIANTLWQTADQQGAKALAEGDAGKAAQLFENSAWRGTAQYLAQDWLEAANSFGKDPSADGLYNMGNALAKAGEFQRALEAYDKSLAIQPNQADALRNRDLVEQLLQQQENQQSKQGDDGDQSDGDEANPEEQEGSTAGSQGTDSQQQSNNDSDAASPDDQQDSDADSAEQSEGGSESQSDADADGSQQSGGQSAVEGTSEGSDEMSDALDEKMDAQTQAQMAKFDEALEKQQALEQWLRRVPDDPGGLLRRKFRYESIQRLRRGEEPDEDIRW